MQSGQKSPTKFFFKCISAYLYGINKCIFIINTFKIPFIQDWTKHKQCEGDSQSWVSTKWKLLYYFFASLPLCLLCSNWFLNWPILCHFKVKQIIWKEGESTNAIMKVAPKFTLKARISRLTGEPTLERNPTNVPGKAAHGALLAQMNLQDTTENILVQSHSNVHTVTGAFQDQITCHFTWSATELVCKKSLWGMTFKEQTLLESQPIL